MKKPPALPMPDVPDGSTISGDELRAYTDQIIEYAKVEFLRGKSGEEIHHALTRQGHPQTTKLMVSQAKQRAEYERLGITEGDKRMLVYLNLASGLTAVIIGSATIPPDWGLIPRIMIMLAGAIGIGAMTKRIAFKLFEKRAEMTRGA